MIFLLLSYGITAYADEPPPPIDDITELSLEELLGGTSGGGTGSFGKRLGDQGVTPYLHAYAVTDLVFEPNRPTTFDAHYFNLLIGADIRGLVIPEAQLEYENGGEEIQLRYGQVDFRVNQKLVFRAGKFLTPFGEFNTTLYPEFISKTPDRPLVLREIVPVAWAEVGVAVHGEVDWSEDRGLYYAAYVVNGLEQSDNLATNTVDDGGSIRDMRNNSQDTQAGDKAFGARFAVSPMRHVRLGTSVYSGAYTVDGQQRLTLAGVDISLRPGKFTWLTEAVLAQQQSRQGTLTKTGGYALISYRVLPALEPLAQVDLIDLDGAATNDRTRFTGGGILYPWPSEIPTAVLKATWATTLTRDNADPTHRAVIQGAVGF